MAARRLNDSRIGIHLDDHSGVRASTHTFSTRHAQHGVALFISLDHVTAGDARGEAVLVPADYEHTVDASGPVIGICFDPERMPRVHAAARANGRPVALDGRLASRLRDLVHAHRARWDSGDVLRGIAEEAHAMFPAVTPRLDRRVVDTLVAIRAGEQPRRTISEAHLQELFARDVGTSMRTYRLWCRLLRALRELATGDDATAAAYAAGFADLAHFSRTCRRMLGYSPTGLRDGV